MLDKGQQDMIIETVVENMKKMEDFPFSERQVNEISKRGLGQYVANIGFMIMTPDTFQRRQEDNVINELARNNIYIYKYKLKYLHDNEIEELYKYGIRKKILNHNRTHWYLTRRGLSFGPSLGLLLFAKANNLCDRLLLVKGKSDPRQNSDRSSIRSQYQSFSRILTLVHTSDDYTSMLREMKLFFGIEDIYQLLENVSKYCNGEPYHSCSQGQLANAICNTSVNATPFEILYSIKCRIADVLANELDQHAGVRDVLGELQARLTTTRAELMSSTQPWVEHHEFVREEMDKVKALLNDPSVEARYTYLMKSALRTEDFGSVVQGNLIMALKQLSDFEGFHDLNFQQLLTWLRAGNVYFTAWEALVVESLLHFW